MKYVYVVYKSVNGLAANSGNLYINYRVCVSVECQLINRKKCKYLSLHDAFVFPIYVECSILDLYDYDSFHLHW